MEYIIQLIAGSKTFSGISAIVKEENMPTIKDVAKAAGVSVGTVSRALNGYKDINDETKERIIQIADKMNYSPNIGAKNLSTKNKRGISILFSDNMELSEMGSDSEREYFFMQILGACRFMEEQNLELAIYHTTSKRQESKSYDQFCEEHGVAGAVCYGLFTTDRYYKELAESKSHCVTVDYGVADKRKPAVMTDDMQAMYELADKVLQKGYKRIVFLNGKRNTEVCKKRLKGIKKALKEHGMALCSKDILMTDFNREKAEALLDKFLEENALEEKTAFMAITDHIAIGAYKSLVKAGYIIGKDVGLTGFDGVSVSGVTNPPIMTVQQNPMEKGYRAAEILMEIVNGNEIEEDVFVPYTIIERPSI